MRDRSVRQIGQTQKLILDRLLQFVEAVFEGGVFLFDLGDLAFEFNRMFILALLDRGSNGFGPGIQSGLVLLHLGLD